MDIDDQKLTTVRLVNDFSFEMLREYLRHLPEKGESWREIPATGLGAELSACVACFDQIALADFPKPALGAARDELIDISVQAMLLWYRLGEELKP